MKNKSLLFFLIVLSFGLFLRFYRLEENFGFDFDQERDAWVVKQIIKDKNLR